MTPTPETHIDKARAWDAVQETHNKYKPKIAALRDLVKAAFHEGHLEGVTSPDQRPDIAWQNSETRAKLEDGE